jgi:hypothetical protein
MAKCFCNIYLNWKSIYSLPLKVTKDPKLLWLQYRITHRILGTNVLLKNINIRNNDNCSLCNSNPETINHLFWECDNQRIYKGCAVWLLRPQQTVGFCSTTPIKSKMYKQILLCKGYYFSNSFNLRQDLQDRTCSIS